MDSDFSIGLDLGRMRDYTALAVVERWKERGAWGGCGYETVERLGLRRLERVALGTPYTEIVDAVGRLTRYLKQMGSCQLTVDATGVGVAVVDMLRAAPLEVRLKAVIITGGERESNSDGYYRVPKQKLILDLQTAIEMGKLEMADGLAEGETLLKEMAEMEVRVGPSGRETIGTWREGAHDDLVFATALAWWGVKDIGRFGFKGTPLF